MLINTKTFFFFYLKLFLSRRGFFIIVLVMFRYGIEGVQGAFA